MDFDDFQPPNLPEQASGFLSSTKNFVDGLRKNGTDRTENETAKTQNGQIPAAKCLNTLKYFLEDEKPGLQKTFYKDDTKLQESAVQASKMVERLVVDHGCSKELALQFTALTLYDLVILLDDSSSMDVEEDGKRKNSLKRVLQEVSTIYTLARPDGLVSVRFLNTRQGRKDIKPDMVDEVLKDVRWYGVTKIGTQLQKKIIDPFIVKKAQQRPLLVMVITDGNVEEEDPGLLRVTIKNCIAKLQKDSSRGENAVAFDFARIGNDEGAKSLIRDLDNDPEIGKWIDCFPVEARIENVKKPEKKWRVLTKLLLGALYRSIDILDEENDDSDATPDELDIEQSTDEDDESEPEDI